MVSRALAAGQGIPPGLQTPRRSVAENTAVGQICVPRQRLLTHEPASATRRRSEQTIGAEVREQRCAPAWFWLRHRTFEHEGMSPCMDKPGASCVVSALSRTL